MVPVLAKGVLCLVADNMLRIHSSSVQEVTLDVTSHVRTSKVGHGKVMGGDTRFLPAWVEVHK